MEILWIKVVEQELEEEDDDEGEEGHVEEDEEEYEEGEVLIPPRVSSSILHGRPFQEAVVVMNNGITKADNDGVFCSICYEACGEHRICCLPCGHIYGLSCIKTWLQLQYPSSPKRKLKDVRVLNADGLCVADEELHKKVRSLEAKCANLEQKLHL